MSELRVDTITDAAGTGAPSFSSGLSLDPANMSDADATMLGLKIYGTGDATLTPSAGSVSEAVLIPYKMQDGSWRLKFNVVCGGFSASSHNVEIGGTSGPSNAHGIAASWFAVNANQECFANNAGTGSTVRLNSSASSSYSNVRYSGDIPLNGKPSWAA